MGVADKEEIRRLISESGAIAVGFAKAEDVDEREMERYRLWLAEGKQAGMDYLARHEVLKSNPSYVLEEASTVISVAFSYAPPQFRDPSLPMIASYAYGADYHDILKNRLAPVVANLKATFGGEWRICIDSAPLAERYWAMKAGIGIKGLNGSVIIGEAGGFAFLAEIVTTIQIPADNPSSGVCKKCGACLSACPQKALSPDGTVDSRRCLNYLTIEHRGEWTGELERNMQTPIAGNTLYGCDICLRVCPHNRNVVPTKICEFLPREEIMALSAERAASMTQQQFSSTFKGSAIKRAKLAGIHRNASNIIRHKSGLHTDDSDRNGITSGS